MAFANKIGNLLKQSISSNPSVYQALRCMSSKLFVGGISYTTDDQSLREAFSNYGEVIEARIIMDRETGRSRGFGFITYASSEEASAAISAMDGKDLHGRYIRVNYAADRTGGGGFRGGYGGGGYGGGSGGYGGGDSSGYGGSGAAGGGYGATGGGYGGSSGYSGNMGSYSGGSGGYSGGGFGAGGVENYNAGAGNFNASSGGGGSFASSSGDNYTTTGDGGFNFNRNAGNKEGEFDQGNQNELLEDDFNNDDGEPDGYANKRG